MVELNIECFTAAEILELWHILTEKERVIAIKKLYGKQDNSCTIDFEPELQRLRDIIIIELRGKK